MFKIDKLSLIMMAAIILAISMLIYNPIQQQSILTKVEQVVEDNNMLLTNQSKQLADRQHSDSLQRHAEHENITNFVQNEEKDEEIEHTKLFAMETRILNMMNNNNNSNSSSNNNSSSR